VPTTPNRSDPTVKVLNIAVAAVLLIACLLIKM
jgi:energy-converting hydrogenase Eha subunit E